MPSEREALRKLFREEPELRDALGRLAAKGKLSSFDTMEPKPGEAITVLAGPDHLGIQGSVQARCECGQLVWLSPSTQAMLKARESFPQHILCPSCFIKQLEKRIEAQ